jgi:murein DD-endopeptidase MepM/ murein hydrolase activator NlpD
VSVKKLLLRKTISILILGAVILSLSLLSTSGTTPIVAPTAASGTVSTPGEKKFIKYVEFNVPYLALKKAMNLDIEAHKNGKDLSWITILAYLGAKYGGDFSRYKSADIDKFLKQLETKSVEEITSGMKYYNYYHEAYSAVLGGLLGKFTENGQEKYGLIGYSPIAKGFPYSGYDDFGARRTYGYSRPHLGHDMMAATGTPVIAVESGIVEALGWNQYGGWRIGIRSFDSKRYYYYAHLRQNRPYAANLALGKVVKAGDVIGYVGRTGYSTHENVNNIKVSHLHFGLQLIFDESQKECDNEIWIDVYALTQLLRQHQSEVVRNNETKEYTRASDIIIESDTAMSH